MLRLRPTYEEMLREAKTKRLRILPERERRTQQGLLLESVNFDEFDLSRYDIRNPERKPRPIYSMKAAIIQVLHLNKV